MGWVYDRHRRTVSNGALGVVFAMALPGPGGGEIALRLESGSTSRWSEKDWADHRGAIAQSVEDERARLKMSDLLGSAVFGGSYASAARAIEKQTGKQVTVRAIQAWVAEPHRMSSRRCPAWALKALRDHIAREGGGPSGANAHAPAWPSRLQMADRHSYEWAENRISRERRSLEEWKSTGLENLPERLSKKDLEVKEWLGHFDEFKCSILEALHLSGDFAEFKTRLRATLDERAFIDSEIRKARAEIEAGRGDADEEGGTPP